MKLKGLFFKSKKLFYPELLAISLLIVIFLFSCTSEEKRELSSSNSLNFVSVNDYEEVFLS